MTLGHMICIADRPQSFGLHSPDQLPHSASEFQKIASNFGLQSPDKAVAMASESEVNEESTMHPEYNPRLFCDGGLYLDPDIIGKIMISPSTSIKYLFFCSLLHNSLRNS